MEPWTRRLRGLPVVAALLLAAGSSSTGGAAARSVPTPTGKQAAHCRALHAQLPAALAGLERRTSAPVSQFTADWGRPAVALRCGVPHPEALKDGSETFDRYAHAWEVGGIEWYPQQRPDGSVRCTAVHRAAFVEVDLPEEYGGDGTGQDVLTELGALIRKTIPEGYA
ncbi:DUF3515 domain-containing protein [Streptomyces sp. URMC 124]|uniref:DUF3515 domain-containing protein n=1 Tax=Streptomyces sp. URMC 124 TaxID=3423405 RepID=UPI003F1B0095